MERSLSFICFASSLAFFSVAKGYADKSISQSCKEKGYKVGTVEFELCCNRTQATENENNSSSRKGILGRDLGGKFDKSRVKDEALDLIPREHSSFPVIPDLPQK